MGWVDCPTCGQMRKLNDWDAGPERCWFCGYVPPVENEQGRTMNEHVAERVSAGPPFPERLGHWCSECFAELYEADRGYGSTAWACPIHGEGADG